MIGSDKSGSNVFFASFQSLVGEDGDAELDFYDTQVCSEGPAADACLTPAAPASHAAKAAARPPGGPQPRPLLPARRSPARATSRRPCRRPPRARPRPRSVPRSSPRRSRRVAESTATAGVPRVKGRRVGRLLPGQPAGPPGPPITGGRADDHFQISPDGWRVACAFSRRARSRCCGGAGLHGFLGVGVPVGSAGSACGRSRVFDGDVLGALQSGATTAARPRPAARSVEARSLRAGSTPVEVLLRGATAADALEGIVTATASVATAVGASTGPVGHRLAIAGSGGIGAAAAVARVGTVRCACPIGYARVVRTACAVARVGTVRCTCPIGDARVVRTARTVARAGPVGPRGAVRCAAAPATEVAARVGARDVLRKLLAGRVVPVRDALSMARVVLPLAVLGLAAIEIAVDIRGLVDVDIDVPAAPVAVAEDRSRRSQADAPRNAGGERRARIVGRATAASSTADTPDSSTRRTRRSGCRPARRSPPGSPARSARWSAWSERRPARVPRSPSAVVRLQVARLLRLARSRCTESITSFGSARKASPSFCTQSGLSSIVARTCGNATSDSR